MEAHQTESASYPFELGAKLPFSLDAPCTMFVYDLRCDETAGFIDVHPFATSSRYRLGCANGHYIRDVARTEVELRFGIVHPPAGRAEDPLAPSRRVALNVVLRDAATCVYCGRTAGDSDFDGPVTVGVAHIVPSHALDPHVVRYDPELRTFARDVQVVTACALHRTGAGLPGFDDACDIFIRSVLRNNLSGRNVAALRIFERLYRLAERGTAAGRRSSAMT